MSTIGTDTGLPNMEKVLTWSSTEYNEYSAFIMNTGNGYVYCYGKDESFYVRAFASVPVE